MIKFFQFPPYHNLPNFSPFCMKVETYLRMTKLPYETINVLDPRKAPKGKLPFIDDNGKKIADSSFIIEYLKTQYGNPLDQHLQPTQKATALALQRLFEEHLYWIILYFRWVAPAGWAFVEKEFFKKLPALPRLFVPTLVRKKMQKAVYEQGIGRHTSEEIYQLGKVDLQTIADILGKQNYFMGNEASSIDACSYGFLANIIHAPIPSPLQDYVLTLTNLVAYCERMKKQFYT